MSYPVYLLQSLGAPRNHHSIFIQTSTVKPNGGIIYQVSGNIQTGMHFNHRSSTDPRDDIEFVNMDLIGRVTKENLGNDGDDVPKGKMWSVVEGVEAPVKQFDGPRRIGKGKLRRCQEWVKEVVEKLREEGILENATEEAEVTK